MDGVGCVYPPSNTRYVFGREVKFHVAGATEVSDDVFDFPQSSSSGRFTRVVSKDTAVCMSC